MRTLCTLSRRRIAVLPAAMMCALMMTLCAGRRADGAREQASAPTVAKITVTGNRLLSDAAISGRLGLSEGQPLDRARLQSDVAALRELPFLADASFTVIDRGAQTVEVRVTVSEQVEPDEIRVEGNAEMDADDILEVISTGTGVAAEKYRLVQDVQAIEGLYQEHGYPFAKADWAVQVDAENRVVLTFRVVEGTYCWVERVQFEGNESLIDDELLDQMESEVRGWPSWIWPGHLDRVTFREDIRAVEQYYWSKGYLDAEVAGFTSHSRSTHEITLNMVIYEGPLYRVGSLSFQGNTVFRADELRRKIPLSEGEPFNPQDVDKSKDRIQELYHQQGYFDVRAGRSSLQEELTYYEEEPRVDVKFVVTEGEPVYIGQVKIEGLTKTRDEVVRRELNFYPGERADSRKFKASERRLRNTGYFDRRAREPVKIGLEPGEGALRDALVEVEEGQTGSLFLGAGYSTQAGLLGQITLTERNFDLWHWPRSWRHLRKHAFRGGGHRLDIRLQAGTEWSNASISFRNPAVWNSDYSFGTRLYSLGRDLDDYDLYRTGANVSIGQEIRPDVEVSVTPGYERIELDDPDENAALEIRRDEGTHSKPYLRMGLTVDRRDDVVIPSEGYQAALEMEVAADDVEAVKFTARGTRYWTVAQWEEWGKHIFSLSGRASVLTDYGKRVPVFERLYAGGMNSLRGFDYYGVSPVDPVTEDQIGGKSLLVGSMEYSVPLLVEEVRLVGFMDAGWVEEEADQILSGWDKLRASVGLGLRWQLPQLGNAALALDIGFPIKREDYDDTRSFHLSLGGARTF